MRRIPEEKRWPGYPKPIFFQIGLKEHLDSSRAVQWGSHFFAISAGSSDYVSYEVDRSDPDEVALLIASVNPRLGYRGAERFVPGKGRIVEGYVFRGREAIQLRKPVGEVFFQGDDYAEVENMGTEEFFEHAAQWW